MEKISKFRMLWMRCQIPLGEVADAAKISHQRLSQIELKSCGLIPQNSETLICALELTIDRKKKELEKVEKICKYERNTVFNYIRKSEII